MARILLVEDDSRLALSVKIRVESQGHQVQLATDGLSALEMAASDEFDLVLLDITLPRLDGLQAAQRMLGAKPMDERAVVLMSGGRADDYSQARVLLDRVELLRKPFTSDELSTCLRKYLVKPSDPARARI
ncbi:MAG: DNA-binding response OmpR family regulator [Planctomycetota bacterium]|jgi:DNA-binding response OmpR family regulator